MLLSPEKSRKIIEGWDSDNIQDSLLLIDVSFEQSSRRLYDMLEEIAEMRSKLRHFYNGPMRKVK